MPTGFILVRIDLMLNPYQEIMHLLITNNIIYKETEHEPVYTSEQAARTIALSIRQIAKSLLLKYEGHFVLVVLPGDRMINSKKLKNLLKAKELRFATPDEVKDKMGCEIGACYPFGNIIGIPTYADNSLSKNIIISFNPGLHTRSIEIKWRDYYSLVKPKLTNVSEK